MSAATDRFATTDTRAEDPAMLIYTSGTTGDPKGALQAHRGLIGHLPGVEFPHRYLPQPVVNQDNAAVQIGSATGIIARRQ